MGLGIAVLAVAALQFVIYLRPDATPGMDMAEAEAPA